MSERFPIPPEDFLTEIDGVDQIDPEFGRNRGRTRRNVALYNARVQRRERMLKMGAGSAHPANTISVPSTGVTAPIGAGQDALPAFLTWAIEFAHATPNQYPATGATNNAMVNTGVFWVGTVAATGVLSIRDAANVVLLSFDLLLSGHTGARGFNQLGVLFDPVNDRLAIFVNGDQVATGTFAHASWSTATWSYCWNTGTGLKAVGVGTVGPLEVFPNFIPPTYRP